MNVKKRKEAVLLRHGWTRDGIRSRRVLAVWKLAGMILGAGLMFVPDRGLQDAGFILMVMFSIAFIIGAGYRV